MFSVRSLPSRKAVFHSRLLALLLAFQGALRAMRERLNRELSLHRLWRIPLENLKARLPKMKLSSERAEYLLQSEAQKEWEWIRNHQQHKWW